MVRGQQLTEDQAIILEHIAEQIKANGSNPTFADIADFTGFTVSKIQRTVDKCVKLKLLKRKELVKNGLKLGSKYKDYINEQE